MGVLMLAVTLVAAQPSPAELAWADFTINEPAGTPVPEYDEWLKNAISLAAVRRELLGEGERQYWFRPDSWETDVDVLRNRRADMADAPPLTRASLLPPVDFARKNMQFNRRVRDRLLSRLMWEQDRGAAIAAAIKETDRLHDVWWNVLAAGDCNSSPYCVRKSLKTLRELIGPQAFEENRLPACVPEWIFEERK